MMLERIDMLVVGLYVLTVFALAWTANRATRGRPLTPEGQYLADRSLTFAESLCSIIGTEVSALTFLFIPAFAYAKDFSFLQIYFGAVVARAVVALVFLPRVYGKGLTLYEVMDRGESGTGRRLVGLFYGTSKVFSIGVRLFSGSVLVAEFMGVGLVPGLLATVVLAFLYTLMGGLKAVVRTDMLQLALFILGGTLAHLLIPSLDGRGWGDMMAAAGAAGKLDVFTGNSWWAMPAGFLGGILFDMSTHGVDQDFAQRQTGNHSLRSGQWAIFLSSFLSISVGLLFLGVGALLWSYYQTHPFPAGVNPDRLFAHFIIEHFPAGLRGLMVAGVLAATMSVMDSSVNALCATLYNDVLPGRQRRSLGWYFVVDNLAVTTLLFGVAMLASSSNGLLVLGLKVQSWTAGALLAVFLSRVVLPGAFPGRFTAGYVGAAYAAGLGAVAFNTFALSGDWNWNSWWGCGAALVALAAYSRLRRPRRA